MATQLWGLEQRSRLSSEVSKELQPHPAMAILSTTMTMVRAGAATICHKTGRKGGGHTIVVDWSGWIHGHRGHGDTLGPCK
jgi:hypothetical protein